MPGHDILFEPLEIRGHTFRNRVVMPPMVSLRNIRSEAGRAWYGEHARGGLSMVIVEATPLGLLVEENLPALRKLVDAIHGGGSLAAIQIWSNGQPEPATSFPEAPLDPHELARDQFIGLIERFPRAAAVCRAAGFDGVEPHGAHGYFLTRCLSPTRNRRDDEYGGPLENRMRAAIEVCRGVRSAIGDGMLLLYRHTPVEGEDGGYDLDDTLRLVAALADEGVDVFDVSPSHGTSDGEYSRAIREAMDLPVIARGELDEPDRAAAMLEGGRADLIAVGRGLIADAEWPNKVREGRLSEIVECVHCDEECSGNLGKGIPITCSQWGG